MKLIKNILRFLYSKFRDSLRTERYPRFAVDRNYYNDDKRYSRYPTGAKFANLGAGPHFYHKRWTCYDFYTGKFDKFMTNNKSIDFTKVSSLDEKFHLMYSSHVFEHIPRKSLDKFLNLIYDALVEGGTIRIQVPDAKEIYESYINQRYEFFEIYESKLPVGFDEEWKLELLLLFLIATVKSETDFDVEYYQKIRENSQSMQMIEFLDWLLEGVEENSPTGHQHVNWFDYEKLKLELEKAGFSDVYLSGFGKSRHAPMKQIPLFDSWLPSISLYVEATK